MTSNRGFTPQPADPGEDIWRILGACLTVGCVIAAAILLSALLVGSILPESALKSDAFDRPSKAAAWGSLIGFQAIAIALIITIVGLRAPGQIRFTFALQPPSASLSKILGTLIVFVLIQGLFSLFSLTFFRDDVMRDLGLFRKMIADTPLWVAFLALVIGAPVSEEILFRGFLMNRLSQTRLKFAGATIAATFGWTILHFGYTTIGLMEVFLAGLLFSWALWRTGSLWVPMALHAAYNALVLAVIVSLPAPVST